VASGGHVVNLQERRTAAGVREHPLEADRRVQVAADRQAPQLEGVDSRELAVAQGPPGVGVHGDCHVRPAAGGALTDARGVAGAADLPAVARIAELEMVGGVEPRLGAQIPIGQRAKALLDRFQRAAFSDRVDSGQT
jgi:hypothetical protein